MDHLKINAYLFQGSSIRQEAFRPFFRYSGKWASAVIFRRPTLATFGNKEEEDQTNQSRKNMEHRQAMQPRDRKVNLAKDRAVQDNAMPNEEALIYFDKLCDDETARALKQMGTVILFTFLEAPQYQQEAFNRFRQANRSSQHLGRQINNYRFHAKLDHSCIKNHRGANSVIQCFCRG
jgi:hypothetical protein